VGRDDTLVNRVGHLSAQARGQPCLFVKDTGVGFKTSPQSDAFAPFKRMSSAGQTSGHGIGLSIVHRIIERHGGQVWLQSEPGKGTTVFMTLGSGA
jgi:signal transduction histidine kinase